MYWPKVTVPVATHVMVTPGSSVVLGHVTVTPSLSETRTLSSSMLPVLVTTYSQVTVVPTGSSGPVGVSASNDSVSVSIMTDGTAPK